VPLEPEAADHPAGDDRDRQARAEVERRDLPSERPNSSASATSLTIGAAIRKENVTPSGMPAVRKPMKSGTAEQEQNGVTTPSPAARTLPADSAGREDGRVRSV